VVIVCPPSPFDGAGAAHFFERKKLVVNSRQKGARGEREWAAYLRENGIDAHRGRQYHGGPDSPDVVSDDGIHWEVKLAERLNIDKAMEQAEGDCPENKIPAVSHKRNRKPWLITLRAIDGVRILREWQRLIDEQTERNGKNKELNG
jgi:hypothetical protein